MLIDIEFSRIIQLKSWKGRGLMMPRGKPDILRFFRQTKISTAVEFAIIGSILMLFIAGAFDL
jgi:Flp pilus assembly protein TadG